jgi:hypothetical protein
LILVSGRPCRADLGFASEHGEEMKLPVKAVLGNLGDAAECAKRPFPWTSRKGLPY